MKKIADEIALDLIRKKVEEIPEMFQLRWNPKTGKREVCISPEVLAAVAETMLHDLGLEVDLG